MAKVTVVVPIYNEAAHVHKIMEPLVLWQHRDRENRRIVVVDDGSTDITPELVEVWRQFDKVDLIYSDPERHENMGKTRAFIEGAKHAIGNGAEVIVTMDADVFDATPEKIDALVDRLGKLKREMVIASSVELGGNKIFALSGQRAIRASALKPGVMRRLAMARGYGLEMALNMNVPHALARDIVFNALPAFRKPVHGMKHSVKAQYEEGREAHRVFIERGDLAKKLRELRKSGKHAEARELLRRKREQHKHFR